MQILQTLCLLIIASVELYRLNYYLKVNNFYKKKEDKIKTVPNKKKDSLSITNKSKLFIQ